MNAANTKQERARQRARFADHVYAASAPGGNENQSVFNTPNMTKDQRRIYRRLGFLP